MVDPEISRPPAINLPVSARFQRICAPAALDDARNRRFEYRLVGGPGFEPGASRSRNLGSLVHRDRFRGFEFISMTQLPVSSRFRPPDLPRVLRELLHDLPVYRSLKPVST